MCPSWSKDELIMLVEPLAARYLAAGSNLGLIVGVHAGGGRHFLSFSASQEGPKLAEDTLFEIGSSTMAFTAFVFADMARKKQGRLLDPVKRFLAAHVRDSPKRR